MSNSVEFYLSKGMDRKMAEYFASGRKTVVSVVANDDFTLSIVFDNKEKRLFDMKPYLQKNTVFEPLMNFKKFKEVYLDSDNSICWDKDSSIDSEKIWSNKIDISTDVCYVDSIKIA